MAITEKEIAERLRRLAENYAPEVSLLAKVKSVDAEANTCTLTDDDGLDVFNVRLSPVVGSGYSILLLPSVGAFVLAVRVEDSEEWVVVASEKADKIRLSGNVEINGGGLGGVVSIGPLTDRLNTLVDTINSHTHPVTVNGSATTQTGVTNPPVSQAPKFNRGDYEDTKTTH